MTDFHLPLVNLQKADVQPLRIPALNAKKVTADVLRLDKIHPVVSGNKWFKLKYHLQEVLSTHYQGILTFGGAWSNHIVAAAFGAQYAGIRSIGIIRGEEPQKESYTLAAAKGYGMQLVHTDRKSYSRKNDPSYLDELRNKFGHPYIIPEGGGGAPGIIGSEEILSLTNQEKYSHVICSIGSGTMYIGLANALLPGQEFMGVPVMKGMHNVPGDSHTFSNDPRKYNQCKISDRYHFGGYARKSPLLFEFMNNFYTETGIPTDFVYTGKLMFACIDLIENNYYPAGSNLLIIHSVGLQGNRSLPVGTLVF